MRILILTLICSCCLLLGNAFGWYPAAANESLLPARWQGALVGRDDFCIIDGGDSLIEVAHWEGLGYNNLLAANPGVNPWLPEARTRLRLPYATLLPAEAQAGITINLAEFRLYLIWPHGDRMRVRIYPIGLGRADWDTPEGDFHVTGIIERPAWVRPASMRSEAAELPTVVGPGPDNPLGSHWIELSAAGYGIHGTNRPLGIGRRVSHGCVRLYPRDIIDLAERVKPGTPVRVIYRPVKVGSDGKRLLVEIHQDFLGRIKDPLLEIRRAAQALDWQGLPGDRELLELVTQARGVPVAISGP
jgi:L,D-transpeptidase ErfK/SrfK